MGLAQTALKIFGLEKRANIGGSYNDFLRQIGVNGNMAGKVNERSALSYAAVYRAVASKAESIAAMPVAVKSETATGTDINFNNPVHHLIKYQPSPGVNAFNYWQTAITHLELWGNHYALINTNNGFASELHIEHPEETTVLENNGKLYYQFKDKPGQTFAASQVIHVKSISTNGKVGLSRIALHRETVEAGIAARNTNAKFWKNGAFFRAVLEIPHTLSGKGRAKEIAEQFASQWGDGQQWSVPVLPGGAKLNPISMPHKDAQYLEGQNFNIEDVARIFNFPLSKLKVLMGATNKNFQDQQIEYVTDGLRPLCKSIESEYTLKLLGIGNSFIKFDLRGLMRGNDEARANFYKTMYYMGVYSPNDILRLEGDNVRDGGNEYFTAVNMQDDETRELQKEKLRKEIKAHKKEV